MKEGLYEFEKPRFNNCFNVAAKNHDTGINQCTASIFGNDVNQTYDVSTTTKSKSLKEKRHLKLGHPSDRVLYQVMKICKVNLSNKKMFCESCQLGKHHALPFKLSDSYSLTPLELIHTDVWGPSPVQSTLGFKYYIQFLDDHSKYSWIFPLRNKSEAFNTFLQFKSQVEKHFDRKIKTLQSDWGGEFISFSQYLKQEGIIFRQSCPDTSLQNGRVKRRHRQIVETGLTLIAQSSMPLHYWWEAFQTAVHLINRLPSTVLKDKSHFMFYLGKYLTMVL